MRILVVEDYAPLASSIVGALREAGWAADHAADGEEAVTFAEASRYDAIVLDLMLPKLGGLEVLAKLRAKGNDSAVLILTARDGVGDRVQGLDTGADDYLVKPFAFEELVSRVRALVRRGLGQAANQVVLGALCLDLRARTAAVDGVQLELTAREFALLELLALSPGTTFSRTAIAEKLYSEEADLDSNVIDVFVARLRRKLDAAGLRGSELVRTQRGEGYRLDPAAAVSTEDP
jgi:two-component system OmpR family response regulator